MFNRNLLLACAAFGATVPPLAPAQSLRGSTESVERMYSFAVREGLPFYETGASVREAVREGQLVVLEESSDYELHRVAFPYALPATRRFLVDLAPSYRRRCGEPLVVTSGVRPETRQPRNSSTLSVHPTGMAVDLRRPDGACLRWLRRTLLELEGRGVIEATEEHHPAHFHIAVFGDDYTRYADNEAPHSAAMEPPRSREGVSVRYRVRSGDSLWLIAHRHDMSVRELIAANKLGHTTIKPGQTLIIPAH
jgi:LysM repeat protein